MLLNFLCTLLVFVIVFHPKPLVIRNIFVYCGLNMIIIFYLPVIFKHHLIHSTAYIHPLSISQ